MKRIPLAFFLVTLGFLALAGCYLLPKEEKVLAPPLLAEPEVTCSTVTVNKGTIESRTTVPADFISVTQTPYVFHYGGSRLKGIAVELGEEVKQCALLAELDTGSLSNRIARQKVLLRKAQVTSDRAVAMGRDKFERELAALDVELAGLQLQDLQGQVDESRLPCAVAGTGVLVGTLSPGIMTAGMIGRNVIDD